MQKWEKKRGKNLRFFKIRTNQEKKKAKNEGADAIER